MSEALVSSSQFSTGAALVPEGKAPTLDGTIGIILVSGIFTAALYGLSFLQVFIFLQRHKAPRWRPLVHSVWVLWFLDTAHLAIFVSHTLYWYIVECYGDMRALSFMIWSLPAGIILTAMSDGIVRLWFIYRLWILSGCNRWLTHPPLVIQLILWGTSITAGVKGLTLHTLPDFNREVSNLLYVTFGLIIVADFWIAASLCYFLYRSRGTLRITRKMVAFINTLIVYTINTGLLTSIVAVVCLITYVTMPADYSYIGVLFPLEKLYFISFMASLNARDWFNDDDHVISSLKFGTQHTAAGRTTSSTLAPEEGDSADDSETPVDVVLPAEKSGTLV